MARTAKLLPAAMVALVVVATAAAVLLGGAWPGSRDTHPPCEQLPTVAQAQAALARNRSLTADLKRLGTGVTVAVGRPCAGSADQALIEIGYRSGAEHDAIAGLLQRRDGFGVPVQLVER